MADQEAQPEAKKPSALMGLIKAIVIVSVLVVVEMVAAAMIIPSAEETEALARKLAKASAGEELVDEGDESSAISEDEATVEVELFTNHINRFNPETDTQLSVQFAVYGVVLEKEKADFDMQFAANTNRIHEQIVLTMHSVETAELASAGLGLLKRRILEKTNHTLGKPLLREVVFTQLNFVER